MEFILIMTVVEVILLMLGGMNLFDSLIYAFGSAGTGGFSNYADSVGHFDSAYIDGRDFTTFLCILLESTLTCIILCFRRL